MNILREHLEINVCNHLSRKQRPATHGVSGGGWVKSFEDLWVEIKRCLKEKPIKNNNILWKRETSCFGLYRKIGDIYDETPRSSYQSCYCCSSFVKSFRQIK